MLVTCRMYAYHVLMYADHLITFFEKIEPIPLEVGCACTFIIVFPVNNLKSVSKIKSKRFGCCSDHINYLEILRVSSLS